MKSSRFSRLISLMIAMAMTIQLMPARYFTLTAESATSSISSNKHEVSVIGEVDALREQSTKHYRLSDGSFVAVSYGAPVHYKDVNGNWQDINNSISRATSGDSYQLNRTDVDVSFSSTLENGTVITTAVGDTSISMSLLDTSQAVQLIDGFDTEDSQSEEIPDEPDVEETVSNETIPENTVAEESSPETETLPNENVSDNPTEEFTNTEVDATVSSETVSISDSLVEGEEIQVLSEETNTSENESITATGSDDTVIETVPVEMETDTIPEEIVAEDITKETVATIVSEEVDTTSNDGLSYNRSAEAQVLSNVSTMLTLQEEYSWDVEDVIPSSLQSSLIYENVFPDTDLMYTIFSHNIKEQIIVNAAQDIYRYDFLLDVDNLTAYLNEDGSVSFVDSNNEQVYSIPVPYMEDADGNFSADVTFTLNETTQGLVLTVEADEEWLNAADRVFPVKIDPSFSLDSGWAEYDIHSVYTMEGAKNTNTTNRQDRYVGNAPVSSSNVGRYHLFLHFNNMADIPDGYEVIDAKLSMYQLEYQQMNSGATPYGLYEVTTDLPSNYPDYYTWFAAMTWNTAMPAYDTSNVIDYVTLDYSQGYRTWNMTELVKKWYAEDTSNTTVALALVDESVLNIYCCSWARFVGYGNSTPTVLTVSYRSTTGIEPYYTYSTMSAANAGMAYIADATGQLKITNTLASYASSTNPFSLNLIYNSDYFSQNASTDYQPPNKLGLNMCIGSGWTLEWIQKIEPETIDHVDYLKYYDGDGTIHYFIEDTTPEDTNYPYYDEDGLGLKLKIDSTNGYTMADDKGNKWIFTNNFLTSVEDSDGNKTNITYNDGKITSISQVNNGKSTIEVATFTYEGDYLSTVTDAAENVYTLNYSDAALTSIEKNEDTIVVYSYEDNCLTSMIDSESGYCLSFTYNNGKISSYKEMGGSATGAMVAVTYPSNSQTTYRNYGEDRTANTNDDILTHYLFDYARRTANAYTTDNAGNVLGATNAVYSVNSDIQKTNNRTIRTATIGIAAQQLLTNSSLETTSGWTFTNTVCSNTTPRTGNYSIAGTLTSEGVQNGQTISEVLTSGTTYTLSAYVNTKDITGFEGDGIYLKVTDTNNNSWTSSPVNYITNNALDNGWVRVSVTFTASITGTHTIAVCNDGAIGTFYADDFQLEKGEAPSSYNLIENGNMEIASHGWTMGTGAAYSTTMGAASSTGSLKVTGNPRVNTTNAYQNIVLNLPGTQTYVLSGWVNANAVPDDDSDPNNTTDTSKECGLRAVITYSDNATETHYASFNSDLSNTWQFVSLTIVPKESAKTVSSIRVICAYEKNANIAYFDNISLLRETAQSMTYDEDGNLISVTSTGLKEDTSTYSNGNLIKLVTGGSGTYEYTYDTTYEHRLTSVTNGQITQTMGYDGTGNVTSTTLSGTGTKTIRTSATYDDNGNLLTAVTDAAGNTVSYAYADAASKMMGLPTSAVDPKGTITATVYDDNGRVTQTGIADTATLMYTYSSGNLSSVQRTENDNSNLMYSFGYDSFGNMLRASVGNRTLATYTYGTGNGLLTQQAYGNGDTLAFTYDDLGRTRTVHYDDGRTLTYVYNGEGKLHSITENGVDSTVIYLYLYDSLGRLISCEQKEGNNSVLRIYQSYDENNRLTGQSWQIGDHVSSETYEYNSTNGSLSKVTLGEDITTTMEYDGLLRLSKSITKDGTVPILTNAYTYLDAVNSTSNTTLQVASKQAISYNRDITYTYTYDANGNITSVHTLWYNPLIKTMDTEDTTAYYYDSQNQLIREDNQAAQKSWSWTYDNAGNILSRTEYEYIEGVRGEILDTVNYAYGDSDWCDLLTSYDGNTITYDSIGNPLTDGTWNYTWQNGRQLASMTDGTTTWQYEYRAGGLRTSRSNGTTTYNYVYNGDKLVQMTVGDNVLYFTYDTSGHPMTMTLNGDLYYYVTNLQGDVIWILDSAGAAILSYAYDAWGKLIAIDGNTQIGELNPLRYRGYVYDNESGLYYLQSRYYDPEMGRFLNADALVSTGQGLLGNNMFAYCNNNPTNLRDSTGNKPMVLFPTIDDAAIDFAEYINSKSISENVEYSSCVYRKLNLQKEILTIPLPNWIQSIVGRKSFDLTIYSFTYKYYYKEPNVGTESKADFSPVQIVGAQAILHTHGAYDTNYDSDIFSDGDKKAADAFHIPIYVATPIGALRKYDPTLGTDIIISVDIPFDPLHPER